VKDLGDKIDGAQKAAVEKAISAVRSALNGNDIDAIRIGYEQLQSKFQEVSANLYKQAAAPQEPQPPKGKPADPDVVDAEFEMVDEKK